MISTKKCVGLNFGRLCHAHLVTLNGAFSDQKKTSKIGRRRAAFSGKFFFAARQLFKGRVVLVYVILFAIIFPLFED
jgi:hypothetical protein